MNELYVKVKKYYVTVLWGESPTYAPMTYVFYSEEAREAYIQGINDAVGWMEAEPIEHDEPKKFSMNDFECLEPWLERGEINEDFKKSWKEYEDENN